MTLSVVWCQTNAHPFEHTIAHTHTNTIQCTHTCVWSETLNCCSIFSVSSQVKGQRMLFHLHVSTDRIYNSNDVIPSKATKLVLFCRQIAGWFGNGFRFPRMVCLPPSTHMNHRICIHIFIYTFWMPINGRCSLPYLCICIYGKTVEENGQKVWVRQTENSL